MDSIIKNLSISVAAALMISAPFLLERRLRNYEDVYEKDMEEMKKNFTEVKQQLKQCVTALDEKTEEKNCHTCGNYLVSGPNGVSDDMVTWSSVHNKYHGNFRMYAVGDDRKSGSWSALKNDLNQYIQVNFPKTRTVTGIVTWERDKVAQWVKSYKVSHSEDMMTWQEYSDKTGKPMVFQGNDGSYIPKTNCLSKPMTANAIRVIPLSWHAHISLRFDIIGC